MTDRPDLDRIEAYCDAATPGPWETIDGSRCVHVWAASGDFQTGCISFDGRPDADFIARAPTDLPAVVAYARRLEAENQRLREANGGEPT